MDFSWLAPTFYILASLFFTVMAYRAGRKYGQIEGFADGLSAHKEVASAREQRQRDEYTAYLRQQEERDERRREHG